MAKRCRGRSRNRNRDRTDRARFDTDTDPDTDFSGYIYTEQPVARFRELLTLIAQVLARPTALQILKALLRYYVQGTGRLDEQDIRKLLRELPAGERLMQTFIDKYFEQGHRERSGVPQSGSGSGSVSGSESKRPRMGVGQFDSDPDPDVREAGCKHRGARLRTCAGDCPAG